MATSIFSLKKEMVEICRRIYERGYVAANDGNVSARVETNRFLMTPTGMSKGFLQPSDLVLVDADGNKVAGSRTASSEAKMHLTIYKQRPDINAVVHAHPPTATGFAVAGIPLTKCVLPEVIISVGSIPIAEYAAPGTQQLADVVTGYLSRYDAVLLENHGAITVGGSITNAHFKMETIEHFAKIMFVAHQLGNVKSLKGQDVVDLVEQRKNYGVRPDAPVCESDECQVSTAATEKDQVEDVSPDFVEQITKQVIHKLK